MQMRSESLVQLRFRRLGSLGTMIALSLTEDDFSSKINL